MSQDLYHIKKGSNLTDISLEEMTFEDIFSASKPYSFEATFLSASLVFYRAYLNHKYLQIPKAQ